MGAEGGMVSNLSIKLVGRLNKPPGWLQRLDSGFAVGCLSEFSIFPQWLS